MVASSSDGYAESCSASLWNLTAVPWLAPVMRVARAADLEAVMAEALAHEGVCVVDVAIDYSHNDELMKNVIRDTIA